MSHFHTYVVAPESDIFAEDLPTFLYRNISKAAVFKASNEISVYIGEDYNPEDCWVICYKEEEFGNISLQTELTGSGYRVIPDSDNFELYYNDEIQIPKLIGYIAFRECVISKEVVEQFRLDFEPELVEELLKRGAYIDPALFELESNTDYVGKYLISYLLHTGIIPEDVIYNVKMRIAVGNIHNAEELLDYVC